MAYGIDVSRQLLETIAKGSRLAGFQAARIDNAGNPSYFGFFDKQGNFYIMKMDTAAFTITYTDSVLGVVDATALWAARATASLYKEYPLAIIVGK